MSEQPALIWVDPHRMAGQPCIDGHRLTTRQIARLVRDAGVDYVKQCWPYLTDEQINGAVWFEGEHGKGKRFRKWYREEWRPDTP